MSEREELIKQQRKEALEELHKHRLVLGRLKKLIQDHHTYETEAFSQSLETIVGELSYHARRMVARANMILVIRQGRLHGLPPEQG